MKVMINVIIFNDIDDIKTFTAQVDETNQEIAKKKLLYERSRIIEYLRDLQDKGIIKFDRRPKNKDIQLSLDYLVECKKVLKESIKKINTIFN